MVCRLEFTEMRGMSSIITFFYFVFPGKLVVSHVWEIGWKFGD